jgi:hypothetical protein
MRADFEQRQGTHRLRLRPGLLLLRWIADRAGTNQALGEQITNLPVAQIAGLAEATHTTAIAEQTAANHPEPSPTAESDTPIEDIPRHAPEAPAPVPAPRTQPPPKLPPAVLTQLRAARDQAETEGRTLTAADIQTVIKLPDSMAQAVLADLTAPAAA